jgi:hypothetical protein
MFRHGDVILKPASGVAFAEYKKEMTIALGEATGHHHTLYPNNDSSKISLTEIDGRRFIHVDGDYFLRHQEHFEIQVPTGIYEIIMEEEYDPFLRTLRRVVD